jgi:ribosomal protein L11 methyltransferase
MDGWIEFRVSVPVGLADAVTSRLFEMGAHGTQEEDSPIGILLLGYFPSSLGVASLEAELNLYLRSLSLICPESKKVSFSSRIVSSENWHFMYRQTFTARSLSRRFFLLPAWDDKTACPIGKIPLRLDAGQAFGTGLHPSTQLCLGLLEEKIPSFSRTKSLRMLDVGTGSGILAIAAEKLGATRIFAIDTDSTAVDAAKKNAELNGTSLVVFSSTPISSIKEEFDMIVANILFETHGLLLPHYKRMLPSGGKLILSGLLADQRTPMRAQCNHHGFRFCSDRTTQEWSAMVFVST